MVLITGVLLGFGIYGTLLLEVKFQYVEFLPSESNLYQWFSWKESDFPSNGEMGTVYLAEMDLNQ